MMMSDPKADDRGNFLMANTLSPITMPERVSCEQASLILHAPSVLTPTHFVQVDFIYNYEIIRTIKNTFFGSML
jgi:hypothetical protein